MRSSLSDTIWLSEKRKRLLLLLMEGPRDMDQIKKSLNVTSKAMMPQIKILMDNDLVLEEDRVFSLSEVGKIIVDNMNPLLSTLEVIEENPEYWATRDLSPIPSRLTQKLGELGDCMVIEPDINHLFDLPEEFTENLGKAAKVRTMLSYFHPLYPKLYSEISQKGIELDLIFTEMVYERMIEECYEEINTMANSKNTKLYILKNDIATTIAVTDMFVYICLFNKNGIYDHKKIMSFDDSAIKWGERFFDSYKEKAEQINKL
ncbi:putative transcriptional regulator [Methanohalophilus levihalophilus]|uniref:helix-turn-helix transcriptional regulator n=1 Tax=Methanohalophilus levihalophilus TaxID=1431282 RepID=UPI001AE6C717|nr:winged helix-turn-helix domain-containing protein [Methanohalophilus levihalophilus]MBP2030445.1 putative transcriptional regulator [Methanohalophilus levihalophilus]